MAEPKPNCPNCGASKLERDPARGFRCAYCGTPRPVVPFAPAPRGWLAALTVNEAREQFELPPLAEDRPLEPLFLWTPTPGERVRR